MISEGGGGGALKSSSQDTFFTRVNDAPQDDFGLGSELKDLSGVVSYCKICYVMVNSCLL